VIAFLPPTCAKPVTPGRTSCRRRWRSLYRGRYFVRSGRGPTRLMSPFITFQSCGSSSSEVDRRKCPNGVSRASSGSKAPFASRMSDMVRTLTSRNGAPWRPGRVWTKNAGAPMRRRTTSARIATTDAQTGAVKIVRLRSSALFPGYPDTSGEKDVFDEGREAGKMSIRRDGGNLG
jgi:hypothetical protein